MPPKRTRNSRATEEPAKRRKIGSDQTSTSQAFDPQRIQQLKDIILNILSKRKAGSTCCPSEAPRQLCPEDWRPLMDTTRAAAKDLVQEGKIEVTQKGVVVNLQGLHMISFMSAIAPV
ncbi:hypothetical protein WJX74_008943 [Apatococcus lobatus]|uniref:DUF3253 domain-containing protein n=1 Tax=Apatococcus lobatus TaxID=904363 RepID=A0AAW1RW71_9CHLO